ncbi:MAG TPA: hypothetical protein VJL36_01140 [Candidatus Paceibacterota bacterium]
MCHSVAKETIVIVKIDSVNFESVIAILEFVNGVDNVLRLSDFDQETLKSLPFPVKSMDYEPFQGSGGGGGKNELLPSMILIKSIKPENGTSTFAMDLEIRDRVWLSNGGFRMGDRRDRKEKCVKVPEDFLVKIYRLIKF